MNVKYRIDYLTLSQVYNIVIRKCPSYMIDLIEFKSHSHCTRSGPLFVKSVQTYGKQSFSYNGSVLWNKLTRNIQMATSKCNFKNLLKQSLLKKMHNEASSEFLFYFYFKKLSNGFALKRKKAKIIFFYYYLFFNCKNILVKVLKFCVIAAGVKYKWTIMELSCHQLTDVIHYLTLL